MVWGEPGIINKIGISLTGKDEGGGIGAIERKTVRHPELVEGSDSDRKDFTLENMGKAPF